jgi:hypothetical protein
MDQKLTTVIPGQLTRVTFTGMQKVPGRKDMYKYKIEVDSGNTIDVGGLSTAPQETAEEGEPAETYEDPDADLENFDPNDESLDETDIDVEEEQLDAAPPARPIPPKKPATNPNVTRARELLGKTRARA